MGQWLSAPMIVAGAAAIMWAYRSSTHEGVNRNL
jgi:prolipoprotein diacylglyceryltransferase